MLGIDGNSFSWSSNAVIRKLFGKKNPFFGLGISCMLVTPSFPPYFEPIEFLSFLLLDDFPIKIGLLSKFEFELSFPLPLRTIPSRLSTSTLAVNAASSTSTSVFCLLGDDRSLFVNVLSCCLSSGLVSLLRLVTQSPRSTSCRLYLAAIVWHSLIGHSLGSLLVYPFCPYELAIVMASVFLDFYSTVCFSLIGHDL